MSKFKNLLYSKTFVISLVIIGIAAWRAGIAYFASSDFMLFNFTPVGAMALFGGAYLSRKYAFALPLLTLWVSDIFITRFSGGEWVLLYDGFLWVYGAFALMVLAGRFFQPNKDLTRFAGTSLLAVFIHWIVTDIGVWLSGSLYPLTLEGLWLCLAAAIPFELNFLAGTLIYGGLLFGAVEWKEKLLPRKQLQDQAV